MSQDEANYKLKAGELERAIRDVHAKLKRLYDRHPDPAGIPQAEIAPLLDELRSTMDELRELRILAQRAPRAN